MNPDEKTSKESSVDTTVNKPVTDEIKFSDGSNTTNVDVTPEQASKNFVVSTVPKVSQDEAREKNDIESDAYFDTYSGYIVIDGLKALKPLIESDRKTLKLFNEKIKLLEMPYHIQFEKKITHRRMTYTYFGRYIYEDRREGVFTSAELEAKYNKSAIMRGRHHCLACKKTMLDKSKESHLLTDSHKVNAKKMADESNVKRVYLQRYDPHVWRKLIGEKNFSQIGVMPNLGVTNLQLQRIESGEIKTNTIILSKASFLVLNNKKIFKDYASYKLG
jgi:hypothetical protein